MGTYLAKPVTDKSIDQGSSPLYHWVCVDMQGWRKTMEDAHVACHEPNSYHVFGVFDGHGGCEVARFCGLHLPAVYKEQNRNLTETFHGLDTLMKEKMHLLAKMRDPNQALNTNVAASAVVIPPSSNNNSCEDTSEKDDDSLKVNGTKEASDNDQDLSSDDEVDETNVVPVVDTEAPSNTISETKEALHESPQPSPPGKEPSPADDQTMNNSGSKDDDKGEQQNKQLGVFHRILKLSPSRTPTPPPQPYSHTTDVPPTIVRNGQRLCNLPDHPVMAGATAIVAVIDDQTRELHVANAGDSRAVLCRNGRALGLSTDHKPLSVSEHDRICQAGGFVNSFGRINGNLNLSRALGDFKYKQNAKLRRDQQMITAEPELRSVALQHDDEFVLLGCDGIWDCLSNQAAVDFVKSRIDTTPLSNIGCEMLDSILSENPRTTQGIGGDNMTILIVDLQPQSRNHANSSSKL